MSNLEQALAQAAKLLDANGIPYMLIGGLALAAWSMPRATLDVDLTLWAPPESLDRILTLLSDTFQPRTGDIAAFVARTRVLPVLTSDNVRIDFLFAAFPFEKTMVERASMRSLGGVTVAVASLEDLILLKLPSSREKDAADVRIILDTYAHQIDWAYVSAIARELAAALEQPAILHPLGKWMK